MKKIKITKGNNLQASSQFPLGNFKFIQINVISDESSLGYSINQANVDENAVFYTNNKERLIIDSANYNNNFYLVNDSNKDIEFIIGGIL